MINKAFLMAGALALIPMTPNMFMGSRLQPTFRALEEINGEPVYQETVTTAASATNATAFAIGARVMIQCDVAAYIRPGGAGVTVTANNGLQLAALEKYYIGLSRTSTLIATLPVSGTSNCKMFVMN